MTVPKSKRQKSQFEVFHHYTKLRREITELLLRDFGFLFGKSEIKLQKQFGGRTYEELSDEEKQIYNRKKERWAKFEEWFIIDERTAIVDALRNIGKEIKLANAIRPESQEELTERRTHQELAIGYCEWLNDELQYAIETLPVNVDTFIRFGSMIDTEIALLKSWRKSDNKFKKTWADANHASNFANVNNNGNANNNNASNANGVRPDFNLAE